MAHKKTIYSPGLSPVKGWNSILPTAELSMCSKFMPVFSIMVPRERD